MDDGFIDSPDAPLPSQGEFRTVYSEKAWWGSKGLFFLLLNAGCFLGLAIGIWELGWNSRAMWILVSLCAMSLILWVVLIRYKTVRSRRETITVDWVARTVTFENTRSAQTNLLDRGGLGVVMRFEDLKQAGIAKNHRGPNSLFVNAMDCSVISGMHFDDPDGLVARVRRIASENPKETLADQLKSFSGGPIMLLMILLAFSAVMIGLFMVLTP